jgi:hypothetical protein
MVDRIGDQPTPDEQFLRIKGVYHDMATKHTNFSTLNSAVPSTYIHPPLNSFLSGHQRV